ncbi:hypothetical protein H4582DRAFT_1951823 [Lactarius indigo]|nr:hypothetical protein H4582DRAFT_1951823 [Lactarius indigo]
MDKTTSVIAALRAGKQPSQSQTNTLIDKLLLSELLQVEQTSGGGELSQNGRKLARDLRGRENLADISATSLDASNDYQAAASSLRTFLQIFWDNCDNRGLWREVQAGERDTVGIKEKTKAEWKTMDTAKVAGSETIGAAQSVGDKTTELKDRSQTRLKAAISSITKKAREDPQYRQSLDTLFNLVQKWLKATGDVAADAAQSTSLESFINDPTPEKHLLAENMAGGKSLEDLYSALNKCVIDIRNDKSLQQWVDDFIAYAKRTFEQVGEDDPQELRDTRQDLRQRWKELTNPESTLICLRNEVREFQDHLQAVRKAHVRLGRDLEETLIDAGASWLWTDLFNVYLPRFASLLKSIPIPRTEYVDNKMEFVLEDLDISSIDEGTSSTAVGALTHVHIKGVQLQLSQLSFYYRDLTSTVGPAAAVDLDIKVRLIPNTPAGLAEATALSAHIRSALEGLDAGWRATGTGVVRDAGGKAEIAIGAEPQVLGPEKHGPKGTLAQPISERAREAGVSADIGRERVKGAAKDVVGKAKEGAKAGLRKVRTFEEMIAEKQQKEETEDAGVRLVLDLR